MGIQVITYVQIDSQNRELVKSKLLFNQYDSSDYTAEVRARERERKKEREREFQVTDHLLVFDFTPSPDVGNWLLVFAA